MKIRCFGSEVLGFVTFVGVDEREGESQRRNVVCAMYALEK